MKKILLLAAASCFFIMQTKKVFGKCHASFTLTRASDNITLSWTDGIGPGSSLVSISPTDHLICTCSYAGVCFLYYPSWYQIDSAGNYHLILSSSSNNSTINLSSEGSYEVIPTGCSCWSFSFKIIIVPTGIPSLTSLTLPFPFSQLSSNININNLRYKIVNAMGQEMEEGKFSGEIILRDGNSERQLQPGIYFVIYYDALDNRQVLTDKVFVSSSE